MRDPEIAEHLGISLATLRTYVTRAAKEGWLQVDDPEARLQFRIAPKVVENIEHFIDQRDKGVTIAAAKGLGLFKSYQAVTVEGEAPGTLLALRIDVLRDKVDQAIAGTVVGTPKRPPTDVSPE